MHKFSRCLAPVQTMTGNLVAIRSLLEFDDPEVLGPPQNHARRA